MKEKIHMSNLKDKRLDLYEVHFGRDQEAELNQEVREMEANSQWVPGIISKNVEIEAVYPIDAMQTAEKYGFDEDLMMDTSNGETPYVVNTGFESHMVRETARSSLCETAKLFGSALGRMAPELFAQTINNGLSVARGSTLMLMRYGKCSALHSNADGGYQVMEISKLLDISTDVIAKRFGEADFIRGSNSHGYTSALWQLPDAQMEMLKKYQQVLNRNGGSKYPINFMPGVRFASSDTAASCATLEPVFFIPRTGVALPFVEGVRIRHTKRGYDKPAIEVFEEKASQIGSLFDASMEQIEKLASISIMNGVNAVVSVCNAFNISKKWGESARVEMERLTAGGYAVNAHDLYLCLTEAIAEAVACKASETVIVDLEDKIMRVLKIKDWSEHDVGGVVAWGQKKGAA